MGDQTDESTDELMKELEVRGILPSRTTLLVTGPENTAYLGIRCLGLGIPNCDIGDRDLLTWLDGSLDIVKALQDGRQSIREFYKPNAALQMHGTLCSLTCWETASASGLGLWVAVDTYEPPETSSPELMGAWILDRHVTEILPAGGWSKAGPGQQEEYGEPSLDEPGCTRCPNT